jgi:hypothetical protein
MGFPAVRFVDDLVPNREYFIVRVDKCEVTRQNVKLAHLAAQVTYRGTKTAFKLLMDSSAVMRPLLMIEVLQRFDGKENTLTLSAHEYGLTGKAPRTSLSAIFCSQEDRNAYILRLKSGQLTEQELCIAKKEPFILAHEDMKGMAWLKKAR